MGIASSLSLGGFPALGYIVINIDPVLLRLGPLAIHWYGLMYVVAILMGLWAVRRWSFQMGIHEDQIWSIFLWTAVAGLIGGRLYYVVQQPDLWQHFILQPINIIAVWDGGMAFFGAIFLGVLTLFLVSRRYGLSPWIAADGGAVFAVVGQIFGRFGNIINGDIVGYALTPGPINVPADTCATAPCLAYVPDPHLPWYATVYLNPGSFHAQFIPYQPAALYEIGMNLIMLFILAQVWHVLPRIRAGYLFTLYLAMYAVSQIIVFFWRDNVLTPFLGIDWLKQAQWTGIFVLVFGVPAFYLLARRFSEPWRFSPSRPLAWPPKPEAGGAKDEQRARSSGAAGQPGTQGGANPGVSLASAAEPEAVDLPPWEPVHPTGGQLRNLFGRPRPQQEAP
jgi:phosphatidylglycerol---prolipoprotein diacylglyceryl transferase